MAKITRKQKRFADEYLIDLNATQAAVRAGYSEKTAYSQGQRMLKNVEVKKYIDERLEQMDSEMIAGQDEVLKYLTSVLRGESRTEGIVVVRTAGGNSKIRTVEKKPSEKDKLKAAELLGKRYGMFTEKLEVEGDIGVTIVDDIG